MASPFGKALIKELSNSTEKLPFKLKKAQVFDLQKMSSKVVSLPLDQLGMSKSS